MKSPCVSRVPASTASYQASFIVDNRSKAVVARDSRFASPKHLGPELNDVGKEHLSRARGSIDPFLGDRGVGSVHGGHTPFEGRSSAIGQGVWLSSSRVG